MPRVIVVSDAPTEQPEILMDEEVGAEIMGDPHASVQVLERLAWAIGDAEVIEFRAAINAHGAQNVRRRREAITSHLRAAPAGAIITATTTACLGAAIGA